MVGSEVLSPDDGTVSQTPLRCAIYTRKSSEEGLEQDFNSLDAQREACAAYVASQKGEGWKPLPDLYDDGGVSGGTLDAPTGIRLAGHIYTAGKGDYYEIADGLPQYPGPMG